MNCLAELDEQLGQEPLGVRCLAPRGCRQHPVRLHDAGVGPSRMMRRRADSRNRDLFGLRHQ